MRHDRGFSLVEIMVALGLASVVSAAMLMLTRAQLIAYESNDQVVKAQQNARAGMDFLEGALRRACGGIASGQVGLNPKAQASFLSACLRLYDGGATSGASFAAGTPGTLPDAIELIYATGAITTNTQVMDQATPAIVVTDVSQFAAGDFALVTNSSFLFADLFQVKTVNLATNQITFEAPAGALQTPAGLDLSAVGGAAGKLNVLRAESAAFYVVKDSTSPFDNMLMYDPDGLMGQNHADAQPLLDGVEDFQLAIGVDPNNDGLITDAASSTDEWLGNTTSDAALLALSNAGEAWNRDRTAFPADVQLRSIRVSLMVKTLNTYPGTPPTLPTMEDRALPVAAASNPRYRPLRMVVAPRAWNLAE